MKRAVAALCALIMCSLCAFAVRAYSSPFDLPEPATPGEAGDVCTVEYSLRPGGTFIYNNNPESLASFNIGKALMIEHDLSGDVYFTSENFNRTGREIILGLQLRNDSGRDVTVTVHNVGYQTTGDYYGQREWTDFFGTRFEVELPKATGYGFDSPMEPNAFEPVTYVVPNGKYIYVIGGTTKDSYGKANVGGTADRRIANNVCVNAAVLFTVEGAEKGVSAAYVCYAPGYIDYVKGDVQQGYVTEKNGSQYGRQYLGSAPALCAQASFAWTIDDSTADSSRLPVKYDVTYYRDHQSYGNYGAYTGATVNTVRSDVWRTHLNSANHNEYVGTDMMPFNCVTQEGESVLIDVYHNDGTSKPANIGNWMVVYEESFTVKNEGGELRSVSVYMLNKGVSAVNVRGADGGLIKSLFHHDNEKPVYTAEIPAGETVTFGLEYVLLANSYGDMTHFVSVDTVSQIRGDYDRSGAVSSNDAIRLLRHILFPAEYNVTQSADYDGDGKVDSNDAITLLRYVLFGA